MPYGCLPTDVKRNKTTKNKKKKKKKKNTKKKRSGYTALQPALQHGDAHEKWFLKETNLSFCFSTSQCW